MRSGARRFPEVSESQNLNDLTVQRIALVDGRDNPVYFAYAIGGNLVAETTALSNTTYWEYDLAGRQIVRTGSDNTIMMR